VHQARNAKARYKERRASFAKKEAVPEDNSDIPLCAVAGVIEAVERDAGAGVFSTPVYPLKDSVILDSGASHHICNDEKRMVDVKSADPGLRLYAGDVRERGVSRQELRPSRVATARESGALSVLGRLFCRSC